jgi:hypothetical protein
MRRYPGRDIVGLLLWIIYLHGQYAPARYRRRSRAGLRAKQSRVYCFPNSRRAYISVLF